MQPFTNATIDPKGNTYFDGKVTSHTITLSDHSRKTLGFIMAGTYHFDTAAAEIMTISDGTCSVRIDGDTAEKKIEPGGSFEIAANSGFTITIPEGICQYICSYL